MTKWPADSVTLGTLTSAPVEGGAILSIEVFVPHSLWPEPDLADDPELQRLAAQTLRETFPKLIPSYVIRQNRRAS